MPLEDNIGSGSTPLDLDETWPLSTDPKSEGDDHIRNVKRVLKNFYGDLNLATLPEGSIPAFFGGRADTSNISLGGGGLEITVPVKLDSIYVKDPESNLSAPLVYAPVGLDSSPKFYKTGAEITIPGQPVDSEQNSSPIGVVLPVTSAILTNSFTFRGGVAIDFLRLTLRDTDVNGAVIIQTASDEELRAGGGISLLAVGDTSIDMKEYWTSIPGTTVYLTVERYDPVTDSIVDTGIVLKGATISGDFVPYFNRTGYPYTLVELQEKVGAGQLNRVLSEQVDGPLAIVSTTNIHTTTLSGDAGVYEWELTVVANFIATNDGYFDLGLSIGGVNQVVAGHSSIGQVASRAIGRVRSYHFTGTYNKADGLDKALIVDGILGSGTIAVNQSRLIINKIG